MEDYIAISTLNDFIFCPYSIYLHNVYMESDENIYHATPQIKGNLAHASTDNKSFNSRKKDITSLTVYSDSLKLTGKIDLYRQDERILVEKKYQLKQIFKGQLYQLWAQYFCLLEMGFPVEKIAFYEISTNRMYSIELPGNKEKQELLDFIRKFRSFSPDSDFKINHNKCLHCIYSNLCDKTDSDNVYT